MKKEKLEIMFNYQISCVFEEEHQNILVVKITKLYFSQFCIINSKINNIFLNYVLKNTKL